VSTHGGERRRWKVEVIDKRGCAVSTGGGWQRLSTEGVGQWPAKADTSAGGVEVTRVLDHGRSSMIMRVPASYSQFTRNIVGNFRARKAMAQDHKAWVMTWVMVRSWSGVNGGPS
jgi:hypothetical protein